MILTCPECATSYFVDESKIPAEGRLVKCANCGARWTAKVEPELELVETPEEGAFAREPAPPPEVETPVRDLPGDALPKVFRAKADTTRKVRQAAKQGVLWTSVAVAVLVALVVLFVFRAEVVRAWPRSAGVFKALGMPVNPTGLAIEEVRAEAVLDAGRPALRVSGKIRNVQDKPADAPPIQIQLLNKAGKPVKTLNAFWSNPKVTPAQPLTFNVSLPDPPASAQDLEVTFNPGAQQKGGVKADAKHPAKAEPHEGLRGPVSAPPPAHAPAAAEPHGDAHAAEPHG
jgi:predicted Zn finger-like uncharacterized protein